MQLPEPQEPPPDPPPGPEKIPAPDKAAPPGGEKPGASGYGSGTPGAAGEPASGAPQPFLINLNQAVELSLFNSREFQDRREQLYVAAMPVTVERFAFAAQWLAVGQILREATGSKTPEGQHNRWQTGSTVGFSKLFSTGALLLFRFANQTVVELTGDFPRHTTSFSTMNLDFIQPLLRGGGRAVTLEPLTQVERNLLYEIRDYARFRKIFYVNLVAGANLGFAVIPTAFGGPSVSITLASPANTTNVVGQVVPGRGTSPPGLASGGITSQSEGYLQTLLHYAQLQQSRDNVARLIRYLERYRDLAESGEVSQLQIDQVEQSLLQGRTDVLQRNWTTATAWTG